MSKPDGLLNSVTYCTVYLYGSGRRCWAAKGCSTKGERGWLELDALDLQGSAPANPGEDPANETTIGPTTAHHKSEDATPLHALLHRIFTNLTSSNGTRSTEASTAVFRRAEQISLC
jgi:hypothetical protein